MSKYNLSFNMKFYVLVLLSMAIPAVISMTEEMKELAATLHKTCVGETGVDEALIDKVNTEKVFADDEKLKCYIKCLMEQTGSVDDDGVIDPDAVVALMPDEIKSVAEPVIKGCGSKVGSSPCENVWLTHKCYLQGNPDVYLLI